MHVVDQAAKHVNAYRTICKEEVKSDQVACSCVEGELWDAAIEQG